MDSEALRGDGNDDPNEQNEGRYTDIDGKPVTRRSLRGRYTRTDQGGPDRETKGAYTDADHADRSAPPPHSVHDRPGKYTRHDQ
ncbi:hypothetical protein [Microbacterium sp. 2MCAF23]|uniref:hypothetical protein n=1 Tax=Microbacterium sp. 2MCAF23 TaxID=3232985 RepID=UPI003F9C0182